MPSGAQGVSARPLSTAPRDGSNLASVLRSYMEIHGLKTQAELAQLLGVDRSLVAKYLNGSRRCHDVVQLRQFAEAMDLPPETFGLLPAPPEPGAGESPATEEAARWKLVRQTLNRQRARLTQLAASLYWGPEWIEGTCCITPKDWMLERPIPLDRVSLSWVDDAPAPQIRGDEAESAPYRPEAQNGVRYARYSSAVRAIAAPSLFENRGSYRLLGLDSHGDNVEMTFGYTTYFDMVNVCEMLGHELAAWSLGNEGSSDKPSMDDLPYRQLVGDLFDLARRPVLPSINTLTIRRDVSGDSFFLHRRAASHVAVAGGQSHVIPAGVSNHRRAAAHVVACVLGLS